MGYRVSDLYTHSDGKRTFEFPDSMFCCIKCLRAIKWLSANDEVSFIAAEDYLVSVLIHTQHHVVNHVVHWHVKWLTSKSNGNFLIPLTFSVIVI